MGGLQEGLAPFYRQLRGGAAYSHPLLALQAKLPNGSEETIDAARKEALIWISRPARAGKLPDEAWQGESFEVLHGGRSAFGARLQMPDRQLDYWVARCELFLQDRFEDRARTFITELSVVQSGTQGMIGLRLQVAEHAAQPTVMPNVPGVFRQWLDRPGLTIDERQLKLTAHRVEDEQSALRLIETIENPTRQLPIVVVTTLENGATNHDTIVDADELASRLIGFAAVYVVDGGQTYALTDAWGRSFSCFHGAVRLYWQPFNPYSQSPYAHPLYHAHQIGAWREQHGEDFGDSLARRLAEASVRSLWRDDRVPSFAKIKQTSLAGARRYLEAIPKHDPNAQITILRQEVSNAERLATEYMEEAARLETLAQNLEEGLTQKRGERLWLRGRIEELEAQLARTGTSEQVPIPDAYGELEEWVRRYLGGRLVLLPRAIRAARKAVYHDVGLVYRCLLFLANQYREAKCHGGPDAVATMNAQLDELGVANEPTGDINRAREQGDEYFPVYQGKKSYLGWHIKKGTAHGNDNLCLRIYYFYDDEDDVIVVGWLPSHLTTRIT